VETAVGPSEVAVMVRAFEVEILEDIVVLTVAGEAEVERWAMANLVTAA